MDIFIYVYMYTVFNMYVEASTIFPFSVCPW